MQVTAGKNGATVLDGRPIPPTLLAAIATGEHPVRADEAARERLARARTAVEEIAARREVYGRTTGVGANSVVVVDPEAAAGHDARLLASHATTGGEPYPEPVARAAMAVRANQLAAGGSGASPAPYDGLVAALSAGAAPLLHRYGGVGTGDLGALAELGLALVGDRPWACPPRVPLTPVVLAPGDVLPLVSSNAITIAEASLALVELGRLLAVVPAVAALTFAATQGNAEAYDAEVAAARPHPGQRDVAARLRSLLDGAGVVAVRLQDRFGLRALPQVHGPAVEAARDLDRVLRVETAARAENPLVVPDGPYARVLHHGNWHEATLTLALDRLRLALVGTAHLSTRRLGMLHEPGVTGLRAFLADGPEGSSGSMGLEYVATGALAHVRALATPASLGVAVLSRGVEDSASFAPEAARAATETAAPLRTILACEVVAAARATRLEGRVPADLGAAPVAGLLAEALDTLPAATADRDLGADVVAAEGLIQAWGLRDAPEVTDE